MSSIGGFDLGNIDLGGLGDFNLGGGTDIDIDIGGIINDGLKGFDAESIQSTINGTVDQTIDNLGGNSDGLVSGVVTNMSVTTGYFPLLLTIVVLSVVARFLKGVVKAVLCLIAVCAAVYFVCYRTHASNVVLPVLNNYIPGIIKYIGEATGVKLY